SSDAGRLYQVDNNWTEAGIHGNNAPPLISALVDGVGSTSANQWVEFDVSDIVMGNGSFSFGLTTTSSSSHYYSTKEGSHAPQLVLTLNNNSVTSPTADFSATPLTGTPPLTVAFSDQTTGQPTSWLWEFGDGTTATVRHPVHTYANAGTYTVKLTVGNAAGSNSKTRTSYITVTTPPPTEFKLTPADGMAGDSFGNAVALSGETAVIGAAWKDQNGANTGVAYVFRQNGSSWLEQAKLIPGDGAENDYFGWDVDINGDVIVVGAPFFSSSTANTRPGAAYIFRKQQGIWVQETKLLASDGSNNNHFGTDVAISGNRVLVGSYQDDAQGIDAGAAYVFYWNGYGWVEEAKLVASDAQATDFFGSSVSLDNDTALIGANGDDDKGDWAGAAYVFQRSGSGWVEKAKLKANDGQANDYFGLSVALVNDLALIGANGEDAQGSNAGAAYLFRGSGANWTQEAKLVANNGGANDYFGTSVTVAENIAIIGSPQHNSANTDSGNVYVFEKNGAAWVESWQLLASDIAAGDQFGYSVAISANNILIGAWEDDDNGNYSGSAYVYTFQ
ncbi:MAG: PKD domain-containing protein, partial [Anaerolineales bacterium]|nr:PKD domain-containing protein [Anaerolineales bacterium]